MVFISLPPLSPYLTLITLHQSNAGSLCLRSGVSSAVSVLFCSGGQLMVRLLSVIGPLYVKSNTLQPKAMLFWQHLTHYCVK